MERGNLNELFHELNTSLFESSLPSVDVCWNTRLRSVFGRCHFKKKGKKLTPTKIDIRWPIVSDRQLRKTMVHEMCHLWAMKEYNERGHGPHFWSKMEACGYPDGHRFDDALPEEIDRYQLASQDAEFVRGDEVRFMHSNNEEIVGFVLRVNRRTLSIQSGKRRFRVSPSLLTLIKR
ncbi:MAG: hypothetical protein CMK59_05355 [Proteobacteria bacterium]|nr:hypothetical protein [Pseudomonadota bacterium]